MKLNENKRLISIFAFILIINLYFVSALSVNIPTPTNTSSYYVNNTLCWQGHCTTDGSWLTGILTYNSSYAVTGDCPAGQVVQNTTNSGVQCVAVSGGADTWALNWTFYNTTAQLQTIFYNKSSNINTGNYNITTSVLNASGGSISDFNPFTTLIQSIGSSTKRWLKGWFKDLDVSGNINVSLGKTSTGGLTTNIKNLAYADDGYTFNCTTDYTLNCDTSGGAITINLPQASTCKGTLVNIHNKFHMFTGSPVNWNAYSGDTVEYNMFTTTGVFDGSGAYSSDLLLQSDGGTNWIVKYTYPNMVIA